MSNDSNVRVAVRIRPLNSREPDDRAIFSARDGTVVVEEVRIVRVPPPSLFPARRCVLTLARAPPQQADGAGDALEVGFDRVFGPESPTRQVYDLVVRDLVDAVMDGFNACVFACGQTASGKTHTMLGGPAQPGVLALAFRHAFREIDERENREFLVRVSYVEIFREELRDLLGASSQSGAPSLQIREDPTLGSHVTGLTELAVASAEEAQRILANGERDRSHGAPSSRSHVIFKLAVESRAANEAAASDSRGVSASTLTFVDLAGSEHPELSRARGDSKLTQLLSPSLGGNAKTAMIAACSPAERDRDATRSTLRYAETAMKIVNCAKRNEIAEKDSILLKMKHEIAELNAQIAAAERSAEDNSDEKLREQHRKAQQDADQFRQKAEQLQHLIKRTNSAVKAARLVGSIDTARKLQKNLLQVSSGRRRIESILVESASLIQGLEGHGGAKLAPKLLGLHGRTAKRRRRSSRGRKRALQQEVLSQLPAEGGSLVSIMEEDDEEPSGDEPPLSEEAKLSEFRELFAEFDTAGEGTLTVAQVRAAIEDYFHVSESDIAEMLSAAGVGESAAVGFERFCRVLAAEHDDDWQDDDEVRDRDPPAPPRRSRCRARAQC